MNRRGDAFGWGLRGFFGYMAGCVVSGSLAVFASDHFVYLSAALILVGPGVIWGLWLGDGKLAVAGGVSHAFAVGAVYLVMVSHAGNFFWNVLPYSSRVGFAVHAGIFLGLASYLTGLATGALVGQMASGKRLRATAARLGARVGLYVPLPVWVGAALTLSVSVYDLGWAALLVVPSALCIGFTAFAAAMGRDKAAQAARELLP